MPGTREETKEIHAPHWAEGEMCVIRRMSSGRRSGLSASYIEVAGPPDDIKTALSDDALEMMNQRIMLAAIESMTDCDGADIPVTPESVWILPPEDSDFILEQINLLNPTLRQSKEEREKFRGAGGSGAEAGEQPSP